MELVVAAQTAGAWLASDGPRPPTKRQRAEGMAETGLREPQPVFASHLTTVPALCSPTRRDSTYLEALWFFRFQKKLDLPSAELAKINLIAPRKIAIPFFSKIQTGPYPSRRHVLKCKRSIDLPKYLCMSLRSRDQDAPKRSHREGGAKSGAWGQVAVGT